LSAADVRKFLALLIQKSDLLSLLQRKVVWKLKKNTGLH
jgi:hypothetical protein